MEETLQVLNRMVEDGVIQNYAMGGAVAAIFYLEPFDTVDLDIFVDFKLTETTFVTLTPIYEYLANLGYLAEGEFVQIDDWPVQFLPVFNPLTDEAVRLARSIPFGTTTTRVMSPEHLVAIMLDTGRRKDFARIGLFIEAGKLDRSTLGDILRRHGLVDKWAENRDRFER